MEESGEFGEGGAEQGGRGTFCAGDESTRGTDEEQMRRWHRGAGGGGQRGQQLRPRRRPDFLGAPWISTPTPQVCLLYAAASGGHVCICSAGDIIRDVVPLTAEGGLRGSGGGGRGQRVSQIASLGTQDIKPRADDLLRHLCSHW